MKDIFAGRSTFWFPQMYHIIKEGATRFLVYLLRDIIYPVGHSFSKPIKLADVDVNSAVVKKPPEKMSNVYSVL